MLSRRQFAIGSAAAASGGLIGGFAGSRLAQSESMRFDRRLPIPPLIDAAKRGNAVKFKVSSGRHAFVKGEPTLCYGYSGPVLGPVIRLRRGDEVEMTVENALDVDTTVHWHGLLVPGDVDGGPHQVIKSGSTWRPRLKVEQPASTAWFHPHLHHDTARQVYMGLTGLIIVDDGSDASLSVDEALTPLSYQGLTQQLLSPVSNIHEICQSANEADANSETRATEITGVFKGEPIHMIYALTISAVAAGSEFHGGETRLIYAPTSQWSTSTEQTLWLIVKRAIFSPSAP